MQLTQDDQLYNMGGAVDSFLRKLDHEKNVIG